MGFLSKLKGLLTGPASPEAEAFYAVRPNSRAGSGHAIRNVLLQNNWLTLKEPSFFGRSHSSPNGHWAVGRNDSDGVSRGGYRDSGNGRVVLVDLSSDRAVYESTFFARPLDAAVSDSGTFIVHDAGFGSALKGDVVAVGMDGRELYRRHYSANVYNIGLSRCGRFAAVQTANAPHDDGNLLEVLDLDRCKAVFSVQPETGWADCYSFDVNAAGDLQTVVVEHARLGRFRYSALGEFQDTQAFQIARLENGDYATKIMSARDLLKTDATLDNAKKSLTTVDAALAEGAKDRPDWAALAYRVRGEACELLGQSSEALDAFDQALSLNPKIGVQKRAMALRKRLGVGRLPTQTSK